MVYQGVCNGVREWAEGCLDKPEWDLYVAEVGGKVVGFAATHEFPDDNSFFVFEKRDDSLWLMFMAVLEEWRGKGIGRKLYEHAHLIALRRRKKHIFIDVAADNPINDWYERLGFKELGSQKYILKSLDS